jgi:hypothetical protein
MSHSGCCGEIAAQTAIVSIIRVSGQNSSNIFFNVVFYKGLNVILNPFIKYGGFLNFVYFSIFEYLCLLCTLIFSLCNRGYPAIRYNILGGQCYTMLSDTELTNRTQKSMTESVKK